MNTAQPSGPIVRRFLLGVPLDHILPENLELVLADFFGQSGSHQIVFLRTRDFVHALRDRRRLACLHQASLVIPVSKSLERAATRVGLGAIQRYAPFLFMNRVLNVLEKKAGGIYLLGDTQTWLLRLEKNLRLTFPGLRFVGRYSGGFGAKAEDDILTAIDKSSPHLLLTGSGLRGGHLWLYHQRKRFPRGIQLWCPEYFEAATRRIKRSNRVSFRKGRAFYQDVLAHPSRLLDILPYVYFKFRVLFYRAFRSLRSHSDQAKA